MCQEDNYDCKIEADILNCLDEINKSIISMSEKLNESINGNKRQLVKNEKQLKFLISALTGIIKDKNIKFDDNMKETYNSLLKLDSNSLSNDEKKIWRSKFN